jgi:hypothetical protein
MSNRSLDLLGRMFFAAGFLLLIAVFVGAVYFGRDAQTNTSWFPWLLLITVGSIAVGSYISTIIVRKQYRRFLNNLGQCLFLTGLFWLVPAGIWGLTVEGYYTVILLFGFIFVIVGLYMSHFTANQIRR